MKTRFRSFKLVLALPLLLACGGGGEADAPEIRVEDPWARAMPLISDEAGAGSNSAVYLTLQNDGGAGDVLQSCETPAATAVEVHESYLVDDVMRMRRVDGLEVPAGASVLLEPGGLHLMLLGITKPLEEGEVLDLTLHFQKAGQFTVSVPIRGPGSI